MAWGRLGEEDWWWEHALDGLMGGVLTGAVTGVAVWLTLRHERRLAQELAGQEAAARLNAAAMILLPAIDGTDPSEDEKLTALQVVAIEFCARAQQRWPATATGFEDLSKALLTARIAAVEHGRTPARVAEMKRLLVEIAGATHTWISDPKQMERLMKVATHRRAEDAPDLPRTQRR